MNMWQALTPKRKKRLPLRIMRKSLSNRVNMRNLMMLAIRKLYVRSKHMTTIDMNTTCLTKSLSMLLPTYPFQRKNHLPTHPMALLRTRQLNLQPSSTAA